MRARAHVLRIARAAHRRASTRARARISGVIAAAARFTQANSTQHIVTLRGIVTTRVSSRAGCAHPASRHKRARINAGSATRASGLAAWYQHNGCARVDARLVSASNAAGIKNRHQRLRRHHDINGSTDQSKKQIVRSIKSGFVDGRMRWTWPHLLARVAFAGVSWLMQRQNVNA